MNNLQAGPGQAPTVFKNKASLLTELWRQHAQVIADNPNLRCAKIEQRFYNAARDGFEKSMPKPEQYFRLDFQNYERAFHELLWIEEAFQSIELRRYDLTDRKIKVVERPAQGEGDAEYRNLRGRVWYLQLKVEGLADGEPAINPGDSMLLRQKVGRQYDERVITRIEGDLVMSKLLPQDTLKYRPEVTRDVLLVSNGIPFKRCHEAINRLSQNYHLKRGLLCDEPPAVQRVARIAFNSARTLESEMDLNTCNTHQRTVIERMIENKCRPKPFILFGPPGTGKTFTLIRAIGQIMARSPRATVLLTANSNGCANNMAKQLVACRLVNPDEVVRLISKSLLVNIPKSQRMPYYQSDWPDHPPRICVTTNTSAGRIPAGFDYIFIDEAGHANEPEALIPMSKLKRDGCVVLAGDPRQLGPVVKLSEVGEYGLGNSILKRLLKMRVYKRNQDGLYMGDLKESYRCDWRIMNFWSKLVYPDKQLISRGIETPHSLVNSLSSALGVEFRYPLVFLHVEGAENSSANSPSRFNTKEAEKCVEVLGKLRRFVEPNRIGVISPYKLQAKTIVRMLTDGALAEQRATQRERRLQKMREKRRQSKQKKKTNNMAKLVVDSGIEDSQSEIVVDESPPISGLEQKWIEFEKFLVDRRDVHKQSAKQQRQQQQTNLDESIGVKIDPVDAFQGSEKDIIIISTVRTPSEGLSVSFIDNLNRFNVSMSRARQYVIVIGHREILKACNYWSRYLKDIERNRRGAIRQ